MRCGAAEAQLAVARAALAVATECRTHVRAVVAGLFDREERAA